MEPDVSMIPIYLFPTSHRLFALGLVAEVIARTGEEGEAEAPLLARVEAAIAADEETHALEARYAGQTSEAQHAPEARSIDQQIDRTLTAMDRALLDNVRSFPATAPIHVASRAVRQALLPRGAAVITQLTFIAELGAVGTILRGASAPALVAQVDTAQVRPHIDQLTDLHTQFRQLVGKGQAGAIGYDTVRSARATGQRNLKKIIVWVLGKYLDDSDAELAARARLLGPILEQNERIRHEHTTTGVVTEIDPVTGDPTGPTV